jgi:glycosyltransferase involved in cell wall biosynthesis
MPIHQPIHFISVIIPAKNASGHLRACLTAVKAQAPLVPDADYEIILVDDGSTDDTAEIGAAMGVRVIRQPNAGPAAARNQGAKHACGQIVAFTDADCIPAPGWLAALTSPFQDPAVSGVKGVYRTRETGLIPRFVQAEYEERYRSMARLERIDFIDTYSAAYRREVFSHAGGFNKIFPHPSVEDQELSFRLAAQGERLVFAPLAAVYHRHDLTVREYAARKFGIGYWKAVMLGWLPERAFYDSYTPPVLRWQIILAGLGGAALACSLLWPVSAWLALTCLALFLLSSLPFTLFVVRRDPGLGSIVWLMLLLRAYCLGIGLALGFMSGRKRRAI